MRIPIVPIDWDALAKKYNATSLAEYSFDGSSAYYDPHEEAVVVTLNVNSMSQHLQDYRPINATGNRFQILKSEDGHYKYVHTNSRAMAPPNQNSLRIEQFVLYDIVSDFIEPFLLSLSSA